MTNTLKVVFHFHCQVMDVQTSDLHKNNINSIYRHHAHLQRLWSVVTTQTVQKQTDAPFVNHLAQVSLSPLPLFLS